MPIDPQQFTSAAALAVLEERYAAWKREPESVDREWQVFLSGFDLGFAQPGAEATPTAAAPATAADSESLKLQQRVDSLIYAYRDLGHTICNLDPIGMNNQSANPELELASVGLSEADLDREVVPKAIMNLGKSTRLRDILGFLKETYCGTIGVEYNYIQDRARRAWLRDRIEGPRNRPNLAIGDKKRILMKLNQAETLETFIHTKFLGQKRFSLEGGEALMPGLEAIIERAGTLGVQEIVMGMAHRGRLNVLCNTLHKSYEEVFTEFEGSYDLSELQGDGDVKYHLGFSSDHVTADGKTVHLTLNFNPSHLEAVDPVVLGRVRGKQRQRHDIEQRATVIPILIHGDAALAGQGLVMEIVQMSNLEGYTVGGTIHLVSNNQIGFTTLPADARSARYCTDIAKMIDAPVFHVNGDDAESVVHACRLALDYRQQFKKDVFVDIVCYRRHGHNETDEPSFTQPDLYARIAKHPTPRKVYTDKLLADGTITAADVDAIAAQMQEHLQGALSTIKAKPAKLRRDRFGGVWQGKTNVYTHAPVATGVVATTLDRIGAAFGTWPADFNIHPKIKRLAEERSRMVTGHGRIDWATGELLALGSLLAEGVPCRLSGQDCRRGTFSQRQSYWYDVSDRTRYKPLDHIQPTQAKLCVYNSLLSEVAVLGFDYGYSLAEPNMLIMWEAQFGDFANGAQVVIDQFIASSESKWARASGIVLLLPHGQEGQGPEHSSARLERYLQACAEDNIQVAYCTTAAQHFHILRRQIKRDVVKPLVLMTPKSHLRSKAASSDFAEFVDGRFREILHDPATDPAKRLVLTSGKIAHELLERRAEEKLSGVGIVRIEQLYPLHETALAEVLAPYLAAKADLVWCQEEPQNMGAWTFIEPYLRRLAGREIQYAGRDGAASPAPGSFKLWQMEQEKLIAAALGAKERKTAKAGH
ncbi:2-oxoglutarate dehydrogenase subunit E1 [Planctomycetota bacterium]|nr:2-oxoglutarate dehydrogenase subunit E1 [Planctomycetota bacterium]